MKKLLFLILFLFSVQSLNAQTQWRRFDFFDFRGALNNGFSPIDINDNEATDLQNVILTTGGNFKTRGGFDNINTVSRGASVVCTGVFFYKKANGDRFLVSLWDDDTIQKMDYAVGGDLDGTWDDITGSLSFSIDADNLASFAVAENILIIEDGLNTTAPYKWDGTGNAVDLGGFPPNATQVAYHRNIAFLIGNNNNKSTLYFSDIGDVENWTTGLSGNVNADTNDGTVLRGIKVGFDALYLWKDYSIHRLTGFDKDSFVLQRMISDVGTLSGQSIAGIGSDFFQLAAQGDIFLYDGGIKLRNISAKIQGTIDGLAFDRFDVASSVVFDDDYYLSVATAGSSTNNTIVVFDTFHLAWVKFKGMNANVMTVAEDANGKEILVFGDYGGFCHQYPKGTNDNGAVIDMFWTTKQYRFPELSPEKQLTLIRIFANQKGNYNLVVNVRSDFEGVGTAFNVSLLGGTSLYGTAIYGTDVYGGQNLIIGRIEPYKERDFFQLHFNNSNLDEPIEMKGFQMFLEESQNL